MKTRTLAEVVAELRNALVPLHTLPDLADATVDMDLEEALADAREARPRVTALLNELSAMAGRPALERAS